MQRNKPLQLISEWSGYLNNYPITVLLRVQQWMDGGWGWSVELYWESQHAIDSHLETGKLWVCNEGDSYESETEAHRFGERYLRLQGFQFSKEVQ